MEPRSIARVDSVGSTDLNLSSSVSIANSSFVLDVLRRKAWCFYDHGIGASVFRDLRFRAQKNYV